MNETTYKEPAIFPVSAGSDSHCVQWNAVRDAVSNGEFINSALRVHQSSAGTWNYQGVASDLHVLAERFVLEFKLEIGTPALTIERLRGAYGHFRRGRNGFGLIDEVAIDENHVRHNHYWRVCGTMLHELLHSWQEHHGKPISGKYHNRQFRAKALAFGLKIDERGFTEYIPGDTPFFNLLKKYGISYPEIPQPESGAAARVGSKLRLFECSCGVKVRVGRAVFHARCLDCNGLFILQEQPSLLFAGIPPKRFGVSTAFQSTAQIS
jgi:hypothetical protein